MHKQCHYFFAKMCFKFTVRCDYLQTVRMNTAEDMPIEAEAKKRAQCKKGNGPRAIGRPFKKLSADVLTKRKNDIEKKLSLLSAKIVLLQDRLQHYELENAHRSE